jgi:5-methyltetrahydropteroyltriglutamate--homocysteine methyltransferase
MKRSTQRILTTHIGSLPRPPDLLEMIRAKNNGVPVEEAAFAARVERAVADTVRRQAECGIDIVADGEMGRTGFIPYINGRLGGFEPGPSGHESFWGESRDARAFPDYYAWQAQLPGGAGNLGVMRWINNGPITYKGQAALQADIARLKCALAGVAHEEAFMPAISPGNIADWQRGRFYQSDEAYLFAIADAMNVEYKAIVDAGLLLQIDDPSLATYYMMHPQANTEECRRWAAHRVEALNRALKGIPADRVRYHTCYSINFGPRLYDWAFKDFIDIVLNIGAGAFSFEAANPRHEHEWKLWKDVRLPDGAILIPGVISNSTALIEHPELVADRLERFASVVGRENVIAGADCGFASFATTLEIHETVAWAKLAALAEGARIASARLWRKAA